MGAWEDALAMWGGADHCEGAVGGFAYDWLCAPEPMSTGIAAFDSLAGGIPRGETCVLAGDAGMGKTAFATQLCYHAAMRGMRPLYCSFEMSRLKCVMRMVACHAALNPALASGLDANVPREVRWSSARPNPDALALRARLERRHRGDPEGTAKALSDFAHECESSPGWLRADATMAAWADMRAGVEAAGGMLVADSLATLDDVDSLARSVAGDGCGLVVVDYAQLVDTGDREEYDRVGSVSRGLRALAKDTGVALVAISALRKVSAGERAAGPSLDWLKGNNALAYDAGQVLFLLRSGDGGQGEGGVREVDLHVAKNRNGASGIDVALRYDAPHNVMASRWRDDDSVGTWAGGADG